MLKLVAFLVTGFILAELVGNSPILSAIVCVGFLISLPILGYKIFKAVNK